MDFSSFVPDLIVSVLSIIFPLTFQYLLTIKPLKQSNKELQNKLNKYSNDLIEEYIALLKEEQNENKELVKELQAKYDELIEFNSSSNLHMIEIDEQINIAKDRIQEIPLDILDFIEKHKS